MRLPGQNIIAKARGEWFFFMVDDTVREVTKQIRSKISSADADSRIRELLIELIEYELRNMHKEMNSFNQDYEKIIQEHL